MKIKDQARKERIEKMFQAIYDEVEAEAREQFKSMNSHFEFEELVSNPPDGRSQLGDDEIADRCDELGIDWPNEEDLITGIMHIFQEYADRAAGILELEEPAGWFL